ncbi:TPA: nucleotidyltransferase domain-containing protein [Legionella pneumophila]|nr:nucleotidyltransferase domain-containing protein [Legionella pneumophila]HEH5931135.1 nucleotidyltransferase domain-containing protein [Legionella pneumophila]HEH5937517.1 nucleotidyltransferase domain-containing protein [Legionella pneumophila]HEH5940876.1 nucleotidyltransferase domain-containing protein [Legionella pneumophila]HEH5944190.1 nucleotidyltransferase domain-containing protein [Legionella pneumophila]
MKEKVLPINDIVLQSIVDELTSTHHCHTIILYGSRARGDFTTSSDYYVAGIKETGEKERIARFDEKHGMYHDIFVYPERDFDVISDEPLCMSDGIVVREKADFGTVLLQKLASVMESSASLTSNEITVRTVWYKKMLARASTRDLEGKYRHIWELYTILEDYFVFRGMRYEGPKKAFYYLKIHDPQILSLFDEALSNIDNVDILEKLIKKITK